MSDERNLGMPERLDEDGKAAYRTIMEYLKAHDLLHTDGCRLFYSPKEWKERKELYGLNSKLIVVYEGADARYCFSMDACCELDDQVQELIDAGLKVKLNRYSFYEGLQAELGKVGLYFEECTGWYSAVYQCDNRGKPR
jgi:hypothetical protein